MKKFFNKKILKEIIVFLVISCLVFIPFVYNRNIWNRFKGMTGRVYNGLDYQIIHGDENMWLRSTKFFKLFFIDKAFHSKQWHEFNAYDQPPVGKYVLGFVLFITGNGEQIREMQYMKQWDFSKDFDWNTASGASPPTKVLYIARLTMALFGAFTCLLLYYIGKRTFNMPVGVISALLLAYNPLMLSCCRRVMTDSLLLFFLTANIALIILFHQSLVAQNVQKAFIFALLIGVNIALAAGTKLNGGITLIIFTLFCLLILITKISQYKSLNISFKAKLLKLKSDKGVKIITGGLPVSILIAVIVFISINPYLYKHPLKNTAYMIEHRTNEIHDQQANYKDALNSLNQRFKIVIKRNMFPQNYVILGTFLKFPIDFCLFIIGFIMLLCTEIKYFIKEHRPSLKSIVLLWVFVTILGLIIWIPLDWDRFHLPVIPCVAMVSAYAVVWIIDKCWTTFNKVIVKKREVILKTM